MAHTNIPKLDVREEHFRIPSPHDGLSLFLRYLPAFREPEPRRNVVLYVHGGTFPSALSIAHRFDGRSWRDELAASGFHCWGLDFHGFGRFSDPYPQMAEPAEKHAPLGRAEDASGQLEQAVRFICAHHRVNRISLIAHSWGSIVSGRFAGRCPELVERLVFFGPIAWRARSTAPQRLPAWRLISLKDQWDRFVADVPPGEAPVLSKRHFDEWGEAYLDVDPESGTRSPSAVKTPSGAFQDIYDAWAGELAYDPALVRAPVAIIRGEWDSMSAEEDAKWLFHALKSSPIRRIVIISRATHLMHLEESRYALYRESISFLMADDQASATHPGAAAHRPTQQQGVETMDAPREQKHQQQIPGYDLGTDKVARSPISMQEWEELKKCALFSEEDVVYLRLSEEVLADQVPELLKMWRGIIFDHPHLRAYDEDPKTHEVDADYAKAVGKRFGQWVIDTAQAKYDQAWLDYQYEIGLRHHRSKKNKTDNGHTLGHIRARDLLAFCSSIVVPMRPFLEKKGHSQEIVYRMYDAWWKSMILQATLWVQPYIREGDY